MSGSGSFGDALERLQAGDEDAAGVFQRVPAAFFAWPIHTWTTATVAEWIWMTSSPSFTASSTGMWPASLSRTGTAREFCCFRSMRKCGCRVAALLAERSDVWRRVGPEDYSSVWETVAREATAEDVVSTTAVRSVSCTASMTSHSRSLTCVCKAPPC